MAATLVNPEDWKPGNPIYYALSLGNDVYTVLNAGHGYAYDLKTNYALTSPAQDVLRFEVRSGDQNWYDASRSNAERSEIASNELIRPDVPVNVSYGFMLEKGARNTATDQNGGWFAVGQLIQDVSDGQAGAPPAMSINMIGEKMVVYVRFKDAGGNVVAKAVYQDTADIQRGHQYDIDIKAVFESDGTGRLVVTRDGVPIVDYDGQMGYTDTKGVYWKEGIYRSAATETVAAQFSGLEISYGDMVKIPAQGASYIGADAPTLEWNPASKLTGNALEASVSGSAAPDTTVQIYNGAKLVATTTTDANGHFTATIQGVGVGSNVLTATTTGADGRISKVSNEVVVEMGKSADILMALDQISHKPDLAAVYLTDAPVFTVSSLTQMRTLVQNDQEALSKIVGDYSFQFWSGPEGNRTLTRYDEKGVFENSYTSTYQNGTLSRETYVNADPNATYSKEVYQYNIANKAYKSSYQAFDKDGRQIYATTSYADGKLASVSQLDRDGTSTVKSFDASGLHKSTSVTLANGTVTTTAFDASGRPTSIASTFADKSSDVKFFTNGVLTSEQIVHAPGSGPVAKEVILANIANATYVTIHQSFSSSNQLLSEFRTRADGSVDALTWLASDGTTRSRTFDAANLVSVEKTTLVDKSTDTKTFKNGVIQRETIVKADGTKEVYDFNVINRPYGTIHTSYDAKGKVIAVENLTPKFIDLKYVPELPAGSGSAPTLALTKNDATAVNGLARTAAQTEIDTAYSKLVDGKLTAVLTGTAEAGAAVLIYDNGRIVGTTIANEKGVFNVDVANLAAGTHVLSASTLQRMGALSADSGTVAVQVTTGADFLANIRSINGMTDLDGVWLTDGNVVTVAAGRLPGLLESYGKAFDAIQGDHTFEMWSGLPGGRTVSRYDADGVLFEKVTQIETDGVLVRKIVEHVGSTDVAKEVFSYNITGKAYVSTYQAYDAAGKLLVGTSTRPDGTLVSTTVGNDDGGSTVTNMDATAAVKSTMVTRPDGSTLTTTFDGNNQPASTIQKMADGTVHSKMFVDNVLINETVVAAPGGDPNAVRTVKVYDVKNQSYVSSQTSYDASGKVTASERQHADGSLDWSYKIGADGRITTSVYDSTGQLVETKIVNAAGPIAKEVFRFDIADSQYLSEHKGYDAAGRLVLSGHQTADGGHDVTLLTHGLTMVSTTKDDTFDSFGGGTFKFAKGFGHDTIVDFQPGTGSRHDTLVFEKGMFRDDNAFAAARNVGDDVVITTLQNDTVTLHGVHKNALVSVDILVV